MENFKVLYLEHDDERIFHKQAMESAGFVVVDLLPEPSEEKLKSLLVKNRYDLVVTDANFLPEGQNHTADHAGEYKLREIISTIREIDSTVKIAVMTNYSPALLKDREDDLTLVDYLWDKGSTPDDFIKWQISAIRRETNREHPEYGLLAVVERLVLQPTFQHPWKTSIINMLNSYKKTKNEKDRMLSVKKHFVELISDVGIQTQFSKLYDDILEMESLNIAGKPQAWGHLRHVLNVFWLGFYFLNSGVIDKASVANRLLFDEEMEVDQAWLLAAMFHDIGYLGEISEEIVKKCNTLAGAYPGKPVKFSPVVKDNDSQDTKQNITAISTALAPANAPLLTPVSAQILFDHGVLSASTIAATFSPKAEGISLQSAAAVILHNLIRPKIDNKFNSRFSFKDYPLGTLLILCDLIQAWERETGQETFMSSVPLEAVHLSKLEIDRDNKNIFVKINYIPFKYILPTDHSTRQMEEKIRENIITYVFPGLNSLDLKAIPYSFKISFFLDGRTKIISWESPPLSR